MLKVVIIGAGVGGLAAASTILKLCPGVDVKVYEKEDKDDPSGYALLLTPNGGMVLKNLGLEAALLAKAERVNASQSYNSSAVLQEKKNVRELGSSLGFPFLAIKRKSLHDILLSQLDDNIVCYGFECKEVKQKGDKVVVIFENDESIEGDIVIIANGASSKLRQSVFPDSKLIISNIISARGIINKEDLVGLDLAEQTSYFYGEQGKRFVILALPNGDKYWNAMLMLDEFKQGAHVAYERIKEGFSNWPDVVVKLMDVNENTVIIRPLCETEPMKSWSQGCITLLGDAAHAVLPTLGQGANQALLDAYSIAKSISKGHQDNLPVPEILQHYQEDRLPAANLTILESRKHTESLFIEPNLVDTHKAQKEVHLPDLSEYHSGKIDGNKLDSDGKKNANLLNVISKKF